MQRKNSPSSQKLITSEKMAYHAEILANRIRARFRHFSRKYRKQNIDCFRLYDWDIPEVRAVVDWYAGRLVVGEYERTQTGPQWLPHMASAVAEALNVAPDRVHLRRRRTKKDDGPRYVQLNSTGDRFEVHERDLRFWVNLDDFLDTGLFADHRDTRRIIRPLAEGKSFLNLYAYTGAFTCAAAAGGASSTVTVDRSSTYIKWAKDNLELNGLSDSRHRFVQSDVDLFLEKMIGTDQRFDLVFVDPPSFFNDEKRGVSFDIKSDHPQLLRNVLKIVNPGGMVFFSTNHQRFESRLGGLEATDIKEITPQTIPEDYRNQTIHRCWKIVVPA